MTPRNRLTAPTLGLALAAALTLGPAFSAVRTQAAATPAPTQQELLRVLQSDAPPAEKAITCKRLAVYGNQETVPALAPLLLNPDLSSWARIALEAIPGPEADAALRDALPKVQGRLLIGVINSIGVRRDAKAVSALSSQLKNSDAGVISAAAIALGRIGGKDAAKALDAALDKAPAGALADVAEGCVLCAERFAAEGQASAATQLYDAVRKSTAPKHKILEATRGTILARKTEGLPLLLEELRAPDKARFAMALRTARELAGPSVTTALTAEIDRATPERQALLVAVLGDRHDPSVFPTLAKAARNGPTAVRLATVQAAECLGSIAAVPVLLDVAALPDNAPAQAARTALVRLPGHDVEADLLKRIPSAAGPQRAALLEIAGRRSLTDALPAIAKSTEDTDAAVRRAALGALGAIGQQPHLPVLVRVLQKPATPQDRSEAEKALLMLCGREGAGAVESLLKLSKNDDAGLRIVSLHALAGVGGTEALGAVRAAVDDPTPSVQDEAVRTLTTWANNWPEDANVAEPLLALAKSGKKESHQVLGLRGYLQFLQGNTKLGAEDRVAKVRELQPLLKSPEAKRSAISIVGATPAASALELLGALATDTAVAEDACAALANLAGGKNAGNLPADARKKSLQQVLELSRNDSTRKKAEDALKALQ